MLGLTGQINGDTQVWFELTDIIYANRFAVYTWVYNLLGREPFAVRVEISAIHEAFDVRKYALMEV